MLVLLRCTAKKGIIFIDITLKRRNIATEQGNWPIATYSI